MRLAPFGLRPRRFGAYSLIEDDYEEHSDVQYFYESQLAGEAGGVEPVLASPPRRRDVERPTTVREAR
jgi:hypothetical protein